MKSWASYAALSAGAIAALAAVLGLTAFTSPDDRRALAVAAAVAWVVQLLTFAVVRFSGKRAVMKAWAAGVVLRFATLAVFAVVVVKVLTLPPTPALLGLATFLFVSTLIETRLLQS